MEQEAFQQNLLGRALNQLKLRLCVQKKKEKKKGTTTRASEHTFSLCRTRRSKRAKQKKTPAVKAYRMGRCDRQNPV